LKFPSSSSGTQLSLLANNVTADKRNKANGQLTTTTTTTTKQKKKKKKSRDVGSGSYLNFFIYLFIIFFFFAKHFFSFAVSLAANSIRNDGPQRDRPPFADYTNVS
jgi:ABC-type Na+ efflux pump permease subunit